MSVAPSLTQAQQEFTRRTGAAHPLPSALPGRVFVYVEEPDRVLRYELDEDACVLRSDSFSRAA